MCFRRFRFVLLLGAFLGAPSLVALPAKAEPSAAEIAVARKLFKEATTLEKEKRWDQAEAKLKQAIAIKETPGLRYHLAFCLEQQGKLVDAMVDYDRAEELIRGGVKAPDVAKLVVSARESLKERIPTLTVIVPEGVEDVVIKVDGRKISSAVAGQPLPQNPGKHSVEVSAPGRQTFEQEVRLGEKERRELNVVLPQAKSEAAPPAPTSGAESPEGDAGTVSTDSSGWSTRTWVLVAEGAVVVAGLGIGIFATLDKAKARDEVDAAEAERDSRGTRSGDGACDNPEPEDISACEQLPGLRDQVDDAGTLQTVGIATAGVGLAAGLVTILVWKPKSASEARRLPRLYAAPTRGGGFLGLGGSF